MARTKNEREVTSLSSQLPSMTSSERLEAMQAFAVIYIGKRTAWCSCCGKEFSSDLWDNKKKKTAECPYCGVKADVKRSAGKRTHDDKWYFSLVRVVGEWQVVRSFFCESYIRKGEPVLRSSVNEVSQCWMKPGCKTIFMGRNVAGAMGGACDIWRMDTPIKVKYDHYRYRLCGESSKHVELLPIIKRNGLKKLRRETDAISQLEAILTDPRAEIIAKGKQWSVFDYYCYHPYTVRNVWDSLRVAMRHKYIIRDASMWIDYIEELEKAGKDLRNPVFICPKNLKREHDRILRIKRNLAEKAERERLRQEMERAAKLADSLNAEYKERIKNVLQVEVKAGKLSLKPLQDIMDFYKEGEELHHCVYKNQYYKKQDILIIGARYDGQRTETIELSLKNGAILQCRGKFNKNSSHHDDIVSLMQSNVQKFINV